MLNYYHSLAPFRESFQTGLPILTYHKLGPRPAGTRLKGLYLSEKLFARQVRELRQAGFVTRKLSQPLPAAGEVKSEIVLTFDDGFVNALRHGVRTLEQFGFTAIQFIVADLIGKSNEWEQREGEAREDLMDKVQIREWLSAGHEIGSHSLTHPHLSRLSAAAAREEISASKKKLEDVFGVRIEHFCYPYGDWNEQLSDYVAEAGYVTACTTQKGVNTTATSRFAFNRISARYPSMNLKAFVARWRAARPD